MLARQAIDTLYQEFIPSLTRMLGPIVCAEVGVLDLSDRDRYIAEHGRFINVAGVYVIADANDVILYVGESAECINGRIWARIIEYQTNPDIRIGWPKAMSHVYGMQIKPMQMNKVCESVLQLLHWKDADSPPLWSKEFERFLRQQRKAT